MLVQVITLININMHEWKHVKFSVIQYKRKNLQFQELLAERYY